MTPWNKGLKGYMKGRIVSKETREKTSISQRGDKNHNWKGGKTSPSQKKNYKYELWRKKVIQRDNSTCVICNKFCIYPIAHHIRNKTYFPSLQYEVNNGVTLCYDCHMIIHNKVSYYRLKKGEFNKNLTEVILSQSWEETSLQVQRILDEAKELYSMPVIPTRAPLTKVNIYAEPIGDYRKQEIKSSCDNKN